MASWIAINQIVTVPIETWLGQTEWSVKYGLDDGIKRAIAKEVEEIVRARERARREAEQKFQMEKMNANQKLQFPRDPGTTTGHLFK